MSQGRVDGRGASQMLHRDVAAVGWAHSRDIVGRVRRRRCWALRPAGAAWSLQTSKSAQTVQQGVIGGTGVCLLVVKRAGGRKVDRSEHCCYASKLETPSGEGRHGVRLQVQARGTTFLNSNNCMAINAALLAAFAGRKVGEGESHLPAPNSAQKSSTFVILFHSETTAVARCIT